MSLPEELDQLETQAQADLRGIDTPEALEGWRIKYLGTKGAIKAAMRQLRSVPPDQRPAVGKAANKVKNALRAAYEQASARLASTEAARVGPTIDITLPGRRPRIGHRHVISQTTDAICEIFAGMGFTVAYGPELEDVRHNFDALNAPESHPSRDPLDNFYVGQTLLLRPQTSTVQIRVMESQPPPVRIVAPGRCYRPDTVDATHSFMFHQVEGLYVDEGVTMADLKSCLIQFCKAYFGPGVATRFRPHYFPFTEPSAEIDILFHHADARSQWLELGGCGMVHPNVLDAVGYDSEKYTGFAFGMGIDRMVMRKYSIPDIRLLFENDVRFLRQF